MLKKINDTLSLLMSKGIEGDTEENRAFERKRRIAQASLMGLAARTLGILSGLVTIPITLPYLGLEQFGIWMTLTGLIAFLSFTDMGVSVGLQSKLTNCDGRNDRENPSYFISSAFLIITLIAGCLCSIAVLLLPSIDLTNIIKLEDENNSIALLKTTQLFIITFAIGLFAGLVQRIFEAYQDGLISNSCLFIGRLLSLFSIFVCINFSLPLSIMVSLYMGLPFIVMILGGILLFRRKSWLRPHPFKIRLHETKGLVKVGGLALSVQIGFAIMMSGPLLVLANKYGAAAVVPFTISQRIFSIVSVLLGVALNPLWPAYGEALGRNDWDWIIQTFKKSFLWVFYVTTPLFLIFTILGQDIIAFWTQDPDAVPNWELLMVCNIWMIFMGLTRVLSMFLNGVERFKCQSVYNLALPAIAICLGWLFSNSVGFTACLIIMVFFGEITRIIAMLLESIIYLKRRGPHLG